MVHLSQLYVTTGKSIALTLWTFVGKLMFLLFSMMSRIVIDFLPRGKRLLISWLQSLSTVILESKKIKKTNVIVSIFFSIYLPWSDGTRWHDLGFWMLSFKPAFLPSSFTFLKRFFSFPLLSAIRVVSSAYLRLLIFLPAALIPAWASSSPAFHVVHSA